MATFELSTDASVVENAALAADAAASRAGVATRELTQLHELVEVVELFATIWRSNTGPPLNLQTVRALAKAGNYVGGAYDGDRLVGACVGFFHAPTEDTLHSHIAGVHPALIGRKVGFALKVHQRAWALRRGVSDIAWTFDPLVSRNAYFNLAKLGAGVDEYLPNFYGSLTDSVNVGDDTDRLLVRWSLHDPEVAKACQGTRLRDHEDLTAATALGVSPHGGPVRGDTDGSAWRVAVPRDIEALRAADPRLAHEWRTAVRETLTYLLGEDAYVAGFDRAGGYLLRKGR